MRCLSASDIKHNKPASKHVPQGKIGRLYDKLQANKGTAINITGFKPNILKATLNQLIDFYGLDIRQTQRGNKRLGLQPEYTLVGEWFGRVYIDYLAERMEKNDGTK